MDSSRSQNPFWLVLLVVGLLGLLSLLKPGLTVGGVELRPVRLLADVLRKAPRAKAKLALPPPNGPADPQRVQVAAPTPADEPEEETKAPAVPNLPGLESFLAALHQTKATGSKTRIAYFGDSMIEGDLLTGDLRNSLQAEFGGTGVGFVPIGSVAADFRETIHQTFSPDWAEYNLVSRKLPANYPLGVSGHVFLPHVLGSADSTGAPSMSESWVAFRAGQRFAPTRRFAEARLFYGPGTASDEVLVTTDNHTVPHELTGDKTLNELVLKPGTPARQMRIDFAAHGPRPVYGVSFESETGITLDNFSFRGNSGMSLTRIPFRQLAAFGKAQDYKLVILHYGVNVANAKVKDYTFYERAMTRVVDRMQRAFPQASILVIGMSDKGYREEGEFVTDPSVPLLVAAQQRMAQRNHVAFWNLFEAMGGENSMVGWVDSSPPLANKDYTHVNSRGARKMAELLFAYLMGEYAHPVVAPTAAPSPTPQRADSAAKAVAPTDSTTR
jgi:lysophospholipase L1-like esterase